MVDEIESTPNVDVAGSLPKKIESSPKLKIVPKVLLTASLIAQSLYGSVMGEGSIGRQAQGSGFGQSEGTETPPVPGLSDGNYDYWQIAKVDLRLNPKTNQYEWTNLLEPGEPGYVNNLNAAGGPPYDVEGYDYVKESQHGGGVTIFEYAKSQNPIPTPTSGK